jgi:hypothetical protein
MIAAGDFERHPLFKLRHGHRRLGLAGVFPAQSRIGQGRSRQSVAVGDSLPPGDISVGCARGRLEHQNCFYFGGVSRCFFSLYSTREFTI